MCKVSELQICSNENAVEMYMEMETSSLVFCPESVQTVIFLTLSLENAICIGSKSQNTVKKNHKAVCSLVRTFEAIPCSPREKNKCSSERPFAFSCDDIQNNLKLRSMLIVFKKARGASRR
ncbi:hypothetical protein L1987_40918 [Smallanthus sonchifolius]|uniref:Uncharacterized protein n=1 Tax=Smallanthus sonchifolius TaxID=185202 RepID=A0ACB9GTW2_9ASTR|nr:hypothetical protein L1987_40918 [Smallanthus sonchifolius]